MSGPSDPASGPDDRDWMRRALEVAAGASESEDVPIGAVLLDREGRVLASARNEREARNDPSAHAEILALRAAGEAAGDWKLTGSTLVVTLEPCVMCAGAIAAARVERLVFGAWDEKAGAAGSMYDVLRDRRLPHRVEVVGGVEEEACGDLIRDFFAARR